MSLLAVGVVLFAFFLLIVAAMVWQETRRNPNTTAVYVIEEAVPFVYARLSDAAMVRLDTDDVLRILEWEVRYLQGLDVPRDHSANPSPVAGSEDGIVYIIEKTAGAGYDYRLEDVIEVLEYEQGYLVDIGAVGDPVEEAT